MVKSGSRYVEEARTVASVADGELVGKGEGWRREDRSVGAGDSQRGVDDRGRHRQARRQRFLD